MGRITEVVKYLIIINVVMYFGTQFLLGEPQHLPIASLAEAKRYVLAMFYPFTDNTLFRPYQVITHMFMHADPMHLIFNMYGLFLFGPPLEARWGSKNFLNFYLICGIGAAALYIGMKYFELQGSADAFVNIPMLGASGAVFGVLAAFGLKFPNVRLQLLFPPVALKAGYFVLIYVAIELFLGVGKLTSGVAHWAHVGGALFGYLMVRWYERKGV